MAIYNNNKYIDLTKFWMPSLTFWQPQLSIIHYKCNEEVHKKEFKSFVSKTNLRIMVLVYLRKSKVCLGSKNYVKWNITLRKPSLQPLDRMSRNKLEFSLRKGFPGKGSFDLVQHVGIRMRIHSLWIFGFLLYLNKNPYQET